jgi:S-adenosylmethionine:tRNA ribosyltransferase-isomerase
MLVSDFDFVLPDRLIAQQPAAHRDHSRLLVVDRSSGRVTDSVFKRLGEFLSRGDVLVVNNTRVFPARLIGRKIHSETGIKSPEGARAEVFLVRQIEALVWEALVKPGKALAPGARILFGPGGSAGDSYAGDRLTAEVIQWLPHGRRIVRFEARPDFEATLDLLGKTPLPPYIKREEDLRLDSERYQTVYAKARGAIAAPTAGLHFTPDLLRQLQESGIEVVEITLHVGYGTFQPVRVERVEEHELEHETYSINDEAAERLSRAVAQGRRIVAVGTTSTRALESAVVRPGATQPWPGQPAPQEAGKEALETPEPAQRFSSGGSATNLFIYPGFEFRAVGGLITNFHLPRSSLLMLVSAFAGRDLILNAYRHAVDEEYRFYSYGDAMLIL